MAKLIELIKKIVMKILTKSQPPAPPAGDAAPQAWQGDVHRGDSG